MNSDVEDDYLIGRVRRSLEMARDAKDSAARLVHLHLAGRYTLAAVRRAMDHPRTFVRSLRPGETSL